MSDGTTWNWIVVDGRFWEFCKVYVVFWVEADAYQTCLYVVSRLRFLSFHMSLNDDGEQRSWRHSETGVANRCDWPCGWTCLNCCVHVFGCCKCGHEHMVQSSCHGTWWKLGKNSDGIWVKMKTSRKSDAMKIEMLYFHVMIWDLNKKFHTFEIIRTDQTLKGGQRYLCRS